ncbi:MAG: PP2C family protein-serine/threonine phosphatase [Bosea sp. (in: a-proteobacteria)]
MTVPNASSLRQLRVIGTMLSDVGLVRQLNEDSVVYVAPSELGTGQRPEGLAVLADGMGGHAAGEVASALAIETVRRRFLDGPASASEALFQAFLDANGAIVAHARKHPECVGMGTTCTAFCFHGTAATIVHVGDSRAYRWRDGAIEQLTEDQTLVAQLVREGQMTPEEASNSPHSNVLMQAMGTRDQIEPVLWHEEEGMRSGDIFLLCSDGLTGCVSDEGIAAILASGGAPDDMAQQLIAATIAAGAHDNVSVGVFIVGDETATADQADFLKTRPIPALFGDKANASGDSTARTSHAAE